MPAQARASCLSRPFARPASSPIALKTISDLGDEVIKVYRVG